MISKSAFNIAVITKQDITSAILMISSRGLAMFVTLNVVYVMLLYAATRELSLFIIIFIIISAGPYILANYLMLNAARSAWGSIKEADRAYENLDVDTESDFEKVIASNILGEIGRVYTAERTIIFQINISTILYLVSNVILITGLIVGGIK